MELLGKAIAWNYWIFVPTSPHLLKYSHYCDNLARSPMDLVSAILLPGYWQYFTEKITRLRAFFIHSLWIYFSWYIHISGYLEKFFLAKFDNMNQLHSSIALYIETNHFICIVQISWLISIWKSNIGLKEVNLHNKQQNNFTNPLNPSDILFQEYILLCCTV